METNGSPYNGTMHHRTPLVVAAVLLVVALPSGAAPYPVGPVLPPAVRNGPPRPRTATLRSSEPWIITSRVVVTRPMEVGDIIVAAGGELIVRDVGDPGLSITGNLWVAQTGRAELLNSTIRFMSIYNGQYVLAAADESTVLVDGCRWLVPNHVHHGLLAVGNASLTLRDTDFDDVQLMAFHHGRLVAQRLDGRFEVILQDSGQITLEDIPRNPGKGALWVWPTFPEGSRATYSPPMPGFVESWDFPPVGSTGIPQSCHLERCNVLLWPLLVQPGSDLTLRDIVEGNWVVVGLHLPNTTSISGLVNGGPPVTHTLDLPDRSLRLEDAAIDTWNLYPEAGGHLTLADSTVGEILAFGGGSLAMERTTVDGSGGYFGAGGSAYVTARDCTFTCDVEATEGSTIELHRCQALPYPADPDGSYTRFGAYDRARLLADGTRVDSTATVGGSGLIAVTWIVDPPAEPPAWGTSVDISGIAAMFTLDPAMALGRWELRAIPEGALSGPVLGSGTANVENPALLGTWIGDDPHRPWQLRLILRDGLGRILSGGVSVPPRPAGSPGARRPAGRSLPR